MSFGKVGWQWVTSYSAETKVLDFGLKPKQWSNSYFPQRGNKSYP